jgi:acetyltransferase-like isoleucine patch superfamily enzyme
MAGVVVNPCCAVGRLCILNTGASLDHDSVMHDHSSLAPHATTGGNCEIGAYSAVSIGAVLIHGVKVGEHSVVGAGAVVTRAVRPYRVVYGVPAREVRERRAGDRYLG